MQNRIRELRKQKGVTMKQLGTALGLAESTISQYETGKREPDLKTLLRISEYFGVRLEDLVGLETFETDAEFDVRWKEITGKPGEQIAISHPSGIIKDISADRPVSDDEIKFALFGGRGDITDEMYEEVKNFAVFVAQREEMKKKALPPQDE